MRSALSERLTVGIIALMFLAAFVAASAVSAFASHFHTAQRGGCYYDNGFDPGGTIGDSSFAARIDNDTPCLGRQWCQLDTVNVTGGWGAEASWHQCNYHSSQLPFSGPTECKYRAEVESYTEGYGYHVDPHHHWPDNYCG